VIRKWGHPFFHLRKVEQARVFLTETQLRRLYRNFGHPSTRRLTDVLKLAGHNDVDEKTLALIRKFYHQCQIHDLTPRHFKFTLQEDKEFNFEIIVDVLYLDKKPVLYVIDTAIAFNGAHFLKSLSAADT